MALGMQVLANDVSVASDVYNCANFMCGSETITYTVKNSVVADDPGRTCIHGEGHENCTDTFKTRYELREYYCHDCEYEWRETVDVAWSRTCSCEE